ncbi:PTS N-acetylmuramic acid transporter subunit IIBC [Sulfurovum lithotrophicum]|uniref:PTS system glucose-specific EIIA component n=1 Tax=Sulfurovum lithotrophicum TaxID=206403 RepID=A0A7U4RPU2_9BACT|nr:PTS glucose transporter subunit IIA [Sulfurovum lithotrophicum]AKF24037.1 PTS N-acetylmuramic acid transporter subunit IIBC [Sulfurovum lithotrophicum]
MFSFFKRKKRDVFAPVDGQLLTLESVDDEVFSQRMAGDGLAILPVGEIFTAPIDGVVSKIFSTNHAYSVKSDQDLEVMVHIGLETVALKGEGFERLAQEGDEVKAGDPIIKADLNYIKAHAKDIVTPILITDESKYEAIDKNTNVVITGDAIMEVI